MAWAKKGLDVGCRLVVDREVAPEELAAALEEFGQPDGTTYLVVEASEKEAEQLTTAGLIFPH